MRPNQPTNYQILDEAVYISHSLEEGMIRTIPPPAKGI